MKVHLKIKTEINRLKHKRQELFEKSTFNLLNGQHMYDNFKKQQLIGDSDYAPFNEAMCVNSTTELIFTEKFINTRAAGHQTTSENYQNHVIKPLKPLFNKEYNHIVLWFGEDMFCQMNLLTMLAYLEQSHYKGRVYLHSFDESEFKVTQTELILGSYDAIYQDVLIKHRRPAITSFELMNQAIKIYLDLLKKDNQLTNYIFDNKSLSTENLVKELLHVFPEIGYGDTQYIKIINTLKQNSNFKPGEFKMNYVELKLTDTSGILKMSTLASDILKEHYDPIVGGEQNKYMLEKFQSAESIKQQLEEDYHYYFVNDQDESTVGFVAFYFRGKDLYLSKFYLEKAHRGKGIAKNMLSFVIEQAEEEKLSSITLNVNKHNDIAIRAYEKLGFINIGKEKNAIGNDYYMDDYVYKLLLD